MSNLRTALKHLGFAAFVSSVLLACGPNAKNEEQYWKNHEAAMVEYKSRWPGFDPLLAAEHTEAQSLWDAAGKLTDEDAKAEKMKEANAKLEVLAKLEEIDSKLDGVRANVQKLNGLSLKSSDDSRRNDAVTKANDLIASVDAALATATPKTKAEALELAGTQVSALIWDSSDDTYKSLTKKPAKSKKR